MSTRIHDAFQRAAEQNRAAFVAYICAGDPDRAVSLTVCRTLIEEGIDLLEIGMPFSDPLADGLTNQLAAERALRAGVTQADVMDLVRQIRLTSEVPIVLYTYYNLVFSKGIDDFVAEAVGAGVDGLLTLDLPPEEATELNAACARCDLKTVYIVAPTTPVDRIPTITRHTTGFIYYVSREGVTGVRSEMVTDLPEKLAAIRQHTGLPVVVGFGISKPEHVAAVASVADGAVVGSDLVNCIARNPGDSDAIIVELQSTMRSLRSGLTP